ncbi:TetR/AcrR family transcriptional regulator [Rhodococcus koreensis]
METSTNATPSASGRAPHLPMATRREMVLDATLRVTLQDSTNVSMETVAAEAGVAKTVLYRCFGTREEMLKALDEREGRRLASELAASLEAARPVAEPALAMRHMLVAYFTAVAAAPDSYRLIYGPRPLAGRIPDVHQARVETVSRLTSMITTWLEASALGSRVDARIATGTAAFVVGIAEAGARLLLGSSEHWTPGELADLAHTLLAGGIPALAQLVQPTSGR